MLNNTTSKPTKIALFANHAPGLHIAEYLRECAAEDQIGALYLTGEQPENDKKILAALNVRPENVFIGPDIIKTQDHIQWFQEQKFDALICVYWPWLLKNNIYSAVTTTVNFHPALLPINRGWFPHVHSLIDGSKTGVTLHKIEEGADTGSIWAQKEVAIQPTDTAKDIYDRLQTEIVHLFKDNWHSIKTSQVKPTTQDESKAVYHAKKEIEALDKIDLNQSYQAKDLINKLRARTFGNRGFAYYEENGEKIYVKISLSKTSKFN